MKKLDFQKNTISIDDLDETTDNTNNSEKFACCQCAAKREVCYGEMRDSYVSVRGTLMTLGFLLGLG